MKPLLFDRRCDNLKLWDQTNHIHLVIVCNEVKVKKYLNWAYTSSICETTVPDLAYMFDYVSELGNFNKLGIYLF